MTRRPSASLVRYILAATLLALFSSARTSVSAQPQVRPTAPLYSADGATVGYATSERGVFFLNPAQWEVGRSSTSMPITAQLRPEGDRYQLQLVLRPDYRWAAATVQALRSEDPQAMFFPTPLEVREVSLFLPPELGAIAARLTPDESPSTPAALYYRLELNASQVALFRSLLGPIAMQGVVAYGFDDPLGRVSTSAPLTVRLPEAIWTATPVGPPPSATRWLADLLDDRALRLRGVIDGRYALGGSISATIAESDLRARFSPGLYRLQSTARGIRVEPVGAADNLTGALTFRVRELGLTLPVEFQARLLGELDLSQMRFELHRLDLTALRVMGSASSFWRTLLQRRLRQADVVQRIGDQLSQALQARILNETLFGIGP